MIKPAPIREPVILSGGALSQIWTLWFQRLVTHINGPETGTELSADPAGPAEDAYVIWQSDGTGSGDDGDIMIKITAGGGTKTGTLVDFSAL